jgi:hypothetical protein
MASGGTKKRVGEGAQVEHRSRTGLVMDQLLSRGPHLGRPAAGGVGARGGADPWTAVSSVLRATSLSLLEGHLTWLVARTPSDDHLSPHRITTEDQARILIRALDEADEEDAVARALTRSWTVDAVVDDDEDEDEDVVRYASDLGRVTEGQPDDSPYVALARSAAAIADEILDHRGTSMPRRRFT